MHAFAQWCCRSGLPIQPDVDDWSWTFGRGDERLVVRRHHRVEGFRLIVTDNCTERSYPFSDLTALVPFQSDMEAFLLKTGWTFLAFSPERRTGRDRRNFPRIEERRRWWTDGLPPA